MIRLQIKCVNYKENNTPILSKDEIEKFAYDVLADYKPHLLKEPGAVGFEHFIESYLDIPLIFRDIYYDNPKSPIFGTTIFGKCVVNVFDFEEEDRRVKSEFFWEDSIIIDNYVMQPGRQGMANSTGVHEGSHYLMHYGITFPEKTRKILCRRENIEGAGNEQNIKNNWIEYQAYYFTSSFTMPNQTFIPLVHEFMREHGLYKKPIFLGDDDDLDIFAKDLLPQYISDVYCVSKRAAFNKLKSHGFIATENYFKN